MSGSGSGAERERGVDGGLRLVAARQAEAEREVRAGLPRGGGAGRGGGRGRGRAQADVVARFEIGRRHWKEVKPEEEVERGRRNELFLFVGLGEGRWGVIKKTSGGSGGGGRPPGRLFILLPFPRAGLGWVGLGGLRVACLFARDGDSSGRGRGQGRKTCASSARCVAAATVCVCALVVRFPSQKVKCNGTDRPAD